VAVEAKRGPEEAEEERHVLSWRVLSETNLAAAVKSSRFVAVRTRPKRTARVSRKNQAM
jgi:hypothetical protein